MYNNLLKTYSICLNKHILSNEVQEFITNYSKDIIKLAFTGSPFNEVSTQELIQQIESRRKTEKKLPTWYNTPNIFFPPKLNLEQTSSEITAKHKTSIVQGNSLADITGGFGVDSFFFSEIFKDIHHFEHNNSISNIAKHNFKVFNKDNITCFTGDALQQLTTSYYDVIYADPSRRHNSKGKVFFLKDCEPNIPDNLELLFTHCKNLLVKTSPMLDITVGLKELKCVSEIHIVAVNNEVKEVLWLLDKSVNVEPKVKTINFLKDKKEVFSFDLNTPNSPSYALPLTYLYVPNAAIMKSGGFDILSEIFQIDKLHRHSHLYTSYKLKDFPGRRFKINQVIPYHKKEIKDYLKNKKANIATRNFPENVAFLNKKWKIKDGGTDYLFFTTLENENKVILDCTKV